MFVRSYLPQMLDQVRGVRVLQPGGRYRWRSEGYATSSIGPHGMVGRTDLPSPKAGQTRVALWGDSQAECVCLPDDQKLCKQIERASEGLASQCVVFPFARSGDDSSDWTFQMPRVENEFGIDVHCVLVTELSDLYLANAAGLPEQEPARIMSSVMSYVPAFAIQAVRNLLTEPDGSDRQLRFGIGPVASSGPKSGSAKGLIDWGALVRAVQSSATKPILLVYAPRVPHISGGRKHLVDPSAADWQAIERASAEASIETVDVSDLLGQRAREGRWPHGFHNGHIGQGHLNAVGCEAIAECVVEFLEQD